MSQASFPFYQAIPAKLKSPKAIRQVKVMVQTLKEVSKPYGAMQAPTQLADFWRREVASADWFDPEKEHLVVVCLDAKLKLKAFNVVSIGLNNQTLLHAREVFRPAISVAAAHVVIIHNHPSGDPSPSSDDVRITRQMVKAGEVLGIPCLDSVIVGQPDQRNPSGFVSMKQAGLVEF